MVSICKTLALFIFVSIFNIAFAQANCLPALEIQAEEHNCQKDADCVFVGDGCRSCGDAQVANKKFKQQIEDRDTRARAALGCVLACEACTRQTAPACISGTCGVREISAVQPKCYLLSGTDEQIKAAGSAVITEWTTQLPTEISEKELAARLVYAETLATNCLPQQPARSISQGIAWILRNRVEMAKTDAAKARRFGSGIHGVIFKPAQFNSSLSTKYSLSQWKEFLCPSKLDVWSQAQKEAESAFSENAQNPFADIAVTNVYYYRHFDSKAPENRPQPPAWAGPTLPTRVRPTAARPELDDCIGFFREGKSVPVGKAASKTQRK